jgi:uncharacterized protein
MSDITTPTRILWRSEQLQSAERFAGGATTDGWRLEGTVVVPIDGEPSEIRYGVDLDTRWRTRRAVVDIRSAEGERTITLAGDGEGRWSVEGAPTQPLDGCIDIDLGFSPATNTLQIRRLGLAVGEEQTLPVAWLSFPELELQPLVQTYTHLSADRWQYASGTFKAYLDVDPNGFVLRYGDDELWTAVAHRTT